MDEEIRSCPNGDSKMAYEYKSITVQAGQLAERCNEVAEEGFSVSNIVKDGNHFYILFDKFDYANDDDEEISNSDELWALVDKLSERLNLVEGALALKIQAEATEEVESPAAE